MTRLVTLTAAVAATIALSVGPGVAATTINNLHTRPVDQISADLNIQPDQFAACFSDVQPATPGTQPTREREMANKAILLPCLQAANAGISNDWLDRVMDKYRGVHIQPAGN